MTKRIILDCDNTMGLARQEIDDGLALLYLLGCREVDLLGVTTLFGNGTNEEAYHTTLSWLDRWQHSAIPVLRGAANPEDVSTDAARFLADTVDATPGEVTIVAIGPLTNLKAAANLDAEFYQKVGRVVCMGGYTEPLRLGWRNIDELNLSADPDATLHMLNSAASVTLMSAQICLQAPFNWRDFLRTGFLTPDIRRAIFNWLLVMAVYCGIPRFYMWDLLPVVYVMQQQLFDDNPVALISTREDLEHGTLNVKHTGPTPQLNLPTHIVDFDAFQRSIFHAWKTALVTPGS